MHTEQVDSLLARYDASNVALVVSVSGGKDSCAMLAMLRTRYPHVPTYAVMADTGFEHVKPVSAEDHMRHVCALLGVDLYVCRNPNKTYLEMVERRGMFPAMSMRQCTSDLKRGPVETWIRRNVRERVIVSCTGIRADESVARSKQQPWSPNARLSVAGRTVFNWMPIFDLSTEDVYQYLAAQRLPLHPVYRRAGGYLDRLSCRVCIFFTPSDLAAVYANDREAFNLIAALEAKLGHTMNPKGTVTELASRALPVLS
jgi:DNA sulfur modification protein DndC